MASTLESVISLGVCAPAVESRKSRYDQIYKENCDRIYSLSFWMTDNELVAEELSTNTFLRAFSIAEQPGGEQIDRAFLAEIRELVVVGVLTLQCEILSPRNELRGNVKRADLERAVIQLPATEKLIFLLHDVEGYEHERISRLLGIDVQESKNGLHQARLQIRNLIAG